MGGGTGTFVVLTGLKKYPVDIAAIVSVMDSGGSTGRLRDQYGVVPPGDLRQCLIALSKASDLWRKLFLYRFTTGDFKGHNFGNIFLTALEKNAKNYQEVIDVASYILQIQGKVIPVTSAKVNLGVKYKDGEIIFKEDLIDTAFHKKSPIVNAFLKPEAEANPVAKTTLEEADYIIIGPGDLYTSLIPNLVVKGVKQSIMNSKASIIYVLNLMTKRGQTTDYRASDHIADLEKYLGRKIDMVIVNNKKIDDQVRQYYKRYNENQVIDNLGEDKSIVRDDLLAQEIFHQKKADKIIRSLVRHDSTKLGKTLWKLIG